MNIFDFFVEFSKSELAKNNKVIIIILIVFLLGIGAYFMWLYMSKIYMKCVQNANEELKKNIEALNHKINDLQIELTKVTKNRDDLLEQSDKLRFYNQMTEIEKMKKKIAWILL